MSTPAAVPTQPTEMDEIMIEINNYQRLEDEGTAVYVRADQPDWFVPTPRADAAIRARVAGRPFAALCEELLFERLLARLGGSAPEPVRERAAVKRLGELKECWFHVTNRCNMRCRHCLFASGDGDRSELDYDSLCSAVDQAHALGCRIFYFTGGEPLIYPRFREVCDRILADPAAHVVILTNGSELGRYSSWLQRQDSARLHFQLSIDGLRENHEALRGAGSFAVLQAALQHLRDLGFPVTLSMSINRVNMHEMPQVVDFAAARQVENVHFMWLFLKGKADNQLFAEPGQIFHYARLAYERAEQLGVAVDNFDIMKTQVFNYPGIRMDLNNACWESLTVGPDGSIYPSPATVYEKTLTCGHLSEGLERVWRDSPLMNNIRSLSVANCEALKDDPLRFLTGGGDIDHSFIFAGTFVGADPYLPLYRRMALYLIRREAQQNAADGIFGLKARMGERVEECDESGDAVCFTHSNCVLSLSDRDGHASIRSFYSQAAEEVNEDIVNPVHYDDALIEHVPEEARVRSYGCGSPVLDCKPQPGEYLVDLGSGTGVECFIAGRQVGARGRVYGIDMSDTMLARARAARHQVAENLGYANIEFRKGFLEHIPLPDHHIDAVISNCVINLSINKRQTFREIFRILKPGGRVVISDIVHSDPIPLDIKLNEKLRGECIGGAMHENDLFGMLADFGFEQVRVIKRFLYREVKGYPFYSLTYLACKAGEKQDSDLIYRGPFAALVTDDGRLIRRGCTARLPLAAAHNLGEDFMLLDAKGQVTNLSQEMSCCCLPGADLLRSEDGPEVKSEHKSGCMICGKPIIMLPAPENLTCHYCGKSERVESCCEEGHFVCDQCHIRAVAAIIKSVCLETREKDVLAIMRDLRARPEFPTHGPHHHPMVPGVLLAGYRNNGGAVSDEQIITGIARGALIPGASCSFFGIDGAAIGVGIAFSVIFGATPFNGEKRQAVQQIVNRVSARIAENPFARCCQRETWIAFKEAQLIAAELLPAPIPAETEIQCDQFSRADHCAGRKCPLMPHHEALALERAV